MTDRRQLSLNAFVYPAGHHEAAWRHPDSAAERIYDVTYYQEIARTAEAAALDAVFLADGPAQQGDVAHNAVGRLEPITLLTAAPKSLTAWSILAATLRRRNARLTRAFLFLHHSGT